MLVILFAVSFIANLLSALAGGGAGLLQLPVLILLGLPFSIALSTHKIASVALGIGAGLKHTRNRSVNIKTIFFILLSGLPGVFIGARIALDIPDKIAISILGILTLGLGLYSISKPTLGLENKRKSNDLYTYLKGGLVLFIIGILNGSLSSGTGLFATTWLVTYFGFTYTEAVAYTLLSVGFFWNGTGALILGLNSDIQWEWLPSLLLGSFLGGYFGAKLSIIKGSRFVKKSFELLCILMGISLIVRGFNLIPSFL